MTQRERVPGIMMVHPVVLSLAIQPVESVTVGAYPEVSLAIFQKCPHVIAAQILRIIRVITVVNKPILQPIVTVDSPRPGAYPESPGQILVYRTDDVVAQ